MAAVLFDRGQIINRGVQVHAAVLLCTVSSVVSQHRFTVWFRCTVSQYSQCVFIVRFHRASRHLAGRGWNRRA